MLLNRAALCKSEKFGRTSATHILNLERHREDQHSPCARMTQTHEAFRIFPKITLYMNNPGIKIKMLN